MRACYSRYKDSKRKQNKDSVSFKPVELGEKEVLETPHSPTAKIPV